MWAGALVDLGERWAGAAVLSVPAARTCAALEQGETVREVR
jgi:hypothetical protein